MSYQFDNDTGGERFYDIITGTDTKELTNMILYAKESNIDLVAVCDAENTVVMITTKRIAGILMPYLNDEKVQPLDSLNYCEQK